MNKFPFPAREPDKPVCCVFGRRTRFPGSDPDRLQLSFFAPARVALAVGAQAALMFP